MNRRQFLQLAALAGCGSLSGCMRQTVRLTEKAKTPNLPFMDYDGSVLKIDTDYFGNRRNTDNPHPGLFNEPKAGKQLIKVWPRK